MNTKVKLRLLHDGDIPLMEKWLHKDHIKKWYDIPGLCSIADWLAEIREHNDKYKFVTHYIALWNDKPIGFCQYYKCADTEEDWYGDIPLPGTYSIDYLIGEEDFLGKGLGKAMISLLISEIFALADAVRIIAQPDEANRASCQSLLANGLTFDYKNKLYCIIK